MSNPFKGKPPEYVGVAYDLLPITPHDTNNTLDGKTAVGLYITVGGVLVFKNIDGVTRTVTVPNNFVLNVAVTHVLAAGTDATGIHAFTL